MNLNDIKNGILNLTIFFSVYSLCVVVSAALQGVYSGYVMLASGMVWSGCFLMELLIQITSVDLKYTEKGWYLSKFLILVGMFVYDWKSGAVVTLLNIVRTLLLHRSDRCVYQWIFQDAEIFAGTCMILYAVSIGKGIAMGLAFSVMNACFCLQWIDMHTPCSNSKDSDKDRISSKNICIRQSLLQIITHLDFLFFTVTVFRNGVYALREKGMFNMTELMVSVLLFLAVLMLCQYFRKGYNMQKKNIPPAIGTLTGMLVCALLCMKIHVMTGVYVFLCMLSILGCTYILLERENRHEKAFRILACLFSMSVMVGGFLLTYISYDGIRISGMSLCMIGAFLICVRIWIEEITRI